MVIKVLVIGESSKLAKEIIDKFKLEQCEVGATNSIELNITKQEIVNLFFAKNHDFDFIINSATYTNVNKSQSDYKTAEMINVDGVAYLAENARNYNIPLIHISTDYVFNGGKIAFIKSQIGHFL